MHLKGKYYEYMAQYKRKGFGTLDGTFTVFTEL
jgi:hypothetical protein